MAPRRRVRRGSSRDLPALLPTRACEFLWGGVSGEDDRSVGDGRGRWASTYELAIRCNAITLRLQIPDPVGKMNPTYRSSLGHLLSQRQCRVTSTGPSTV